jgi:exodeoxyribonuclease VII small subunit
MAREKPARPPDEAGETGFEESMDELEHIVEELEGGALTLDQSLAHYEKGMALAKRLTQTLDQAEKRIEKLVESESGEPATEPFEPRNRSGGGPSPEGELPF